MLEVLRQQRVAEVEAAAPLRKSTTEGSVGSMGPESTPDAGTELSEPQSRNNWIQ
jgi:hypothetical protein